MSDDRAHMRAKPSRLSGMHSSKSAPPHARDALMKTPRAIPVLSVTPGGVDCVARSWESWSKDVPRLQLSGMWNLHLDHPLQHSPRRMEGGDGHSPNPMSI